MTKTEAAKAAGNFAVYATGRRHPTRASQGDHEGQPEEGRAQIRPGRQARREGQPARGAGRIEEERRPGVPPAQG
jgi:hypothetical protein